MKTERRNVCMGVVGAREHYAAARALDGAGRLLRLYTDLWCAPSAVRLAPLPGIRRRLEGRFHPSLRGRVSAWSLGAFCRLLLLRARSDVSARHEQFMRTGRWFAQRVGRRLAGDRSGTGCDHYMGYTNASLETFSAVRGRDIRCVLNQIDCGPRHYRLLREEREKWPGWDVSESTVPERYWDRVRAEWRLADRIVVNSVWSRDALSAEGVPVEKMHIIPLCYEGRLPRDAAGRRRPGALPLKVLWVGAANLMKGFPYLVEAVRALPERTLQVRVAGQVGIRSAMLANLPGNIEFLGHVPYAGLEALFAQSDVLVFPTLSDGFGLVQLEAMAHGLPVIATPHCGQVVSNGVDGFIVPAADADALADRLDAAAHAGPARETWRENALRKAAMFNMARYAKDLEPLF